MNKNAAGPAKVTSGEDCTMPQYGSHKRKSNAFPPRITSAQGEAILNGFCLPPHEAAKALVIASCNNFERAAGFKILEAMHTKRTVAL